MHRYEKALQLVGEEVRESNPSPGNKAGGLTTLEEKSLGCIHKGGHSPVNAVYDYAKQVESNIKIDLSQCFYSSTDSNLSA